MSLKGQTRARVRGPRVRSRADLTPSFPVVNSRSHPPSQGRETPAGSQPPRGMAPEQLISSPLKEADKTGSLSPRTWSRPGRRAAGRGQARSGDPYAPTRASARGHRGEGQRVGAKFALRALAGSGEGRFPPGGNLGALR